MLGALSAGSSLAGFISDPSGTVIISYMEADIEWPNQDQPSPESEDSEQNSFDDNENFVPPCIINFHIILSSNYFVDAHLSFPSGICSAPFSPPKPVDA